MKKNVMKWVGVLGLSAGLLCAGNLFAVPTAYAAENEFNIEEVESEKLMSSSFSGTFGENSGLRWYYVESTKTVVITGEDYMNHNNSIYTQFYEDAEHVVFKNCRMITANFDYFFRGMSKVKDIDFSGLEVGELCTYGDEGQMAAMFFDCSSLESVDLSFLNITGYDVVDMNSMFYGCTGLDYVDLSSFDLLDVKAAEMFSNCKNLKVIKTPKNIKSEIILPKTFDDSKTDTWHTRLSSINTGITLMSRDANGWSIKNDKEYWYEEGVKQGTTGRGKEIYDPESDAWYWLDAVQDGAKAVSKDVYQESSGGKWVRYDENGHMIKGWQTTESGDYYFDVTTGAMAKGNVTIDGYSYYFDETTGRCLDRKNCEWVLVDGQYYWYEKGVRQGTEGRGKEIYDPKTDAWYWLDAVQNGAKAVSKDVYQESNGGKWVRYDENGHMIKGWSYKNGKSYYFDKVTGAMFKGYATIDGRHYYFDEVTGAAVR